MSTLCSSHHPGARSSTLATRYASRAVPSPADAFQVTVRTQKEVKRYLTDDKWRLSGTDYKINMHTLPDRNSFLITYKAHPVSQCGPYSGKWLKDWEPVMA